MKKIFAPASIVFSILCLLVFFLVGLFVAWWLDVAAGQGLAGAAIVLFYGMVFSLVAVISSFFVTFNSEKKTIVAGNWILLVLLLIGISVVYIKGQQSDRNQIESDQPAKTPTIPSAYLILLP